MLGVIFNHLKEKSAQYKVLIATSVYKHSEMT